MRLELGDAWSGWASTLIGAILGAITVVLGVFLAYRYEERSRRNEMREVDARKEAEERAAAAAHLMVELSNLRDAVCGRRKGWTGTSKLWPMRNALFTTYVQLSRYPSYRVVHGFYDTCLAWRQWVRDSQLSVTAADLVATYPVVQDYQKALGRYGDEVIKILQDQLEAPALTFVPPALPTLPRLPAQRP